MTLHVLRFTFFVLLLAGCASAQAETDSALTASGFIEGDEVTVAPEIGGRIAELLAGRGEQVQAGDLLVRLDDATLQSQLGEAEAGLASAQANLDRVLAGARSEEIAAARASLSEAKAHLAGAEEAVLNAREVISNPQSLNAEIDGARTQVQLAEQEVEMTEANLAETKLKHDLFVPRGGDTKRTWQFQLQAAQAAQAQKQAQLEGARAYLGVLLAMRDNPLTQKAQLHKAEMEAKLAEARVAQAQAKLDELEAGPTDEEVAIAEAQVAQAEAAVRLVEARIDHLTLTAPMSGTVSSRSAQVGETATAGAPLLTITNLDEVTLVIYIPENRIGQVQVGQEVEVKVDSFPERVFMGQVASIAGEAEFTPRNVQTKEERVNLVFAVDISLPNPDHALKPGMPADATLHPPGAPAVKNSHFSHIIAALG
jgi:multidrug resistance efflux pump